MGLNESYGNIRSNVLAKRHVITVNEAYAIVTQEESQRTLGVTDTLKGPLTMLAGKGHEFRLKRPGLMCDYCGYKGHLKESCYKIVGYPSDFKSKKKGQNTGGRTYVNNATSGEKQAPMLAIQGNFFTEDQYKQLVNLLQKTTTNDCSASIAAIITFMTNAAAYDHVWIVDLGATHHVTHCKNVLDNLRKADHRTDGVQLPTNGKAKITHTRDAIVLGNTTIKGVLRSTIARRFWGDYVRTAVYLINKLPTSILQGKSPYELLFGKPAKIDHLRVFGCLCYASNLPTGDTFTVRVKMVVLIGYSETQKGYRLYDLESRSVFVSRDVASTTCPCDSNHNPEHAVVVAENTTTKVENGSMDTVIDHAGSGEEHEIAEVENASVDIVIDHAGSGEEHETTTVAPINENPIPAILEPAAETTIEEAGIEEVHSKPTSIEVETRKSSRQGRLSVWLKDYITISKTHTNTSFKEAAHNPRWIEAIDQEIKALEENHTWEVVDFPEGKKLIGSKWVFKIKYKSTGEVDRF
ncbi:uncharacterized protein LOC142171908 [Nicotiana tabacum]|uniref:Uncharacterized protein LOC142171908 n=1 Tax=Nicotiana tabacum TaxID=4097 RepID=A0AC58T3C4_TOBAC